MTLERTALLFLGIAAIIVSGQIAEARISNPGSSSSGSSVGYPFTVAGNATSTLTQFNGGLTAFASSTIGNGTQASGLTISGGATTTGNAYFGGTGTTTFASGQGITMGSIFTLMGSTGKIGIGAVPPPTLGSPVQIVSTGAGIVSSALTLGNASNAANSGTALDFDVEPTIGAGNFFARIAALRTNVPVNTDTDLIFSVRGNSLLAEAMRIKNSGNLGIGTSSPFSRLHVSSGASATTTVTIGEIGLTSSKGCVNMNASDGTASSFYISAAHTIVAEANYCK